MFGKLFKKRGLSPERFGDEIVSALCAAPDVQEVTWDEDVPFALQVHYVGDDGATQITLENAYRDYAHPAHDAHARDAIMNEWVKAWSSPVVDAMLNPAKLLPLVRHYEYLGEHLDEAGPTLFDGTPLSERYEGPLFLPFCGDLILILAEDLPDQIKMVHADMLAEVGLDSQAAWEGAFDNLQQSHASLNWAELPGGNVLALSVESQHWFTPTLLLLADLFQDVMSDHNLQKLHIALPARNAVLISLSGPDALEELVREKLHEPHPQSALIFEWQAGQDACVPVAEVLPDGRVKPV